MDDLEEWDLVKNGFEPATKKQWDNQGNSTQVKTGPFVHRSFEPEPTIILRTARQTTASIGGLSFKLSDKADLEKFVTKIIPTFCELK